MVVLLQRFKYIFIVGRIEETPNIVATKLPPKTFLSSQMTLCAPAETLISLELKSKFIQPHNLPFIYHPMLERVANATQLSFGSSLYPFPYLMVFEHSIGHFRSFVCRPSCGISGCLINRKNTTTLIKGKCVAIK